MRNNVLHLFIIFLESLDCINDQMVFLLKLSLCYYEFFVCTVSSTLIQFVPNVIIWSDDPPPHFEDPLLLFMAQGLRIKV